MWSVCGAGAWPCLGGIGLILVPRKFEGDPGTIHSWIPVTALSRVTEGPLRSARSHGTWGRGDKRRTEDGLPARESQAPLK